MHLGAFQVSKMMRVTLLFAVLLLHNSAEGLKLGQICSSNCNNGVRGCDRQGCGHYGASRGSRVHKGIDIMCTQGSLVMAPFDGNILRRSFPYVNNNQPYNNGLYIEGTGTAQGLRVKIFYFTPSRTSGTVKKGAVLGTSQPLPYEGITQHLHFQLYKNGVIVNPEQYL